MAESLIALTEGSGAKNLHSFQRVVGINTVEDQVVLMGEPYLAGYIATPATSGARSTATASSHIFQIMAGASLKVRIRRILLYQAAAATAATLATVALQRLSTAGTGGGVETVVPLDPSDAGAGATCMTLPTVKGTVGALVGFRTCYMMQTIAASAQLQAPLLDWDFDRLHQKPLIIPAGAANGICLQWNTATAGASVLFEVWLDESNY